MTEKDTLSAIHAYHEARRGKPNFDPPIRITSVDGNCPVQAEGFVGKKPFYFRARGDRWSLSIGDHPIDNPEWKFGDQYGDGPYDAGWMPVYEVLQKIGEAIGRYAEDGHVKYE
jgi:hypothetical protein